MRQINNANGKIDSILNRPKSITAIDIRNEIQEWAIKLRDAYSVYQDNIDSRAWEIRIELIKNIAYKEDNTIALNMNRLKLCPSSFNTYQHYAFLIRIAYRFNNDKWLNYFNNQQLIHDLV